jgi:hypothetical protein
MHEYRGHPIQIAAARAWLRHGDILSSGLMKHGLPPSICVLVARMARVYTDGWEARIVRITVVDYLSGACGRGVEVGNLMVQLDSA